MFTGVTKITCLKCTYFGLPKIFRSGPHITATCAICGGFLKFIGRGDTSYSVSYWRWMKTQVNKKYRKKLKALIHTLSAERLLPASE